MNLGRLLLASGSLFLLAVAVACGSGADRNAARDAAAPTSTSAPRDAAAPVESGPPKRIFAKRFVVHVFESPNREAKKLGYLRGGAVLQATTATALSREGGCVGGWYELTTGGFVCNGPDVQTFVGKRLPAGRAVQPDLDAPLPYQYGGLRRESPLYRRLPTDEEAAQYEGYVIPGVEPVAGAEGAAPAEGAAAPPAAATPAPAPAPVAGAQPAEGTGGPGSTAVVEEPTGPPTLADLQGERGSVVYRHLMPGFIVSLDRTFRIGERRYWRTQQNGFVPIARVGLRHGSEFRGVVIDGQEWALPIAFMVERGAGFHTKDAHGRIRAGRGRMAYHDRVRVLGREDIGGTSYLQVTGDRYVRASDVTPIEARPRPEGVGPDEQWIDVDLAHQTLVAYEGDRPVFATLVSTGRIREPGDPELDHRTPTGTFRITAKHISTAMDGDSAVDGPYSIDDVPYVMYFHQAYALHSAFWHDRFGHPKSHGCVNMAPEDAKWVFRWSRPTVQPGWHGAFTAPNRQGTVVVVRGETPGS